jgi:hypothetical protein
LKLVPRVAEIEQGRTHALAKHFLNGAVTHFEGLETKRMERALLRRGKDPDRRFSDNSKTALATDEGT